MGESCMYVRAPRTAKETCMQASVDIYDSAFLALAVNGPDLCVERKKKGISHQP